MKRLMYISLVVTMWVILMSGEAWARPWWWHWSPWGLWGRVKAPKSAVAALQHENKAQQEQISALVGELALARGMIEDLTTRLASAENQISEVTAGLAAVQSGISGFDTRLATAEEGLKNVQGVSDLGEFVTVIRDEVNGVKGPHLIFEGANVHVRSGSYDTEDKGSLSGLGNLIIGYNEVPGDLNTGDRGGSHNLVVGSHHRFRSWGGLVAGYENTISGPYASVSGGGENEAKGEGASVSGGLDNTAIGDLSSVSGGGANVASGYRSSVSGGSSNEATGDGASVSGGGDNVAGGYCSSVSGGGLNQAGANGVGDGASVSGGFTRTVFTDFGWAAGGLYQDY